MSEIENKVVVGYIEPIDGKKLLGRALAAAEGRALGALIPDVVACEPELEPTPETVTVQVTLPPPPGAFSLEGAILRRDPLQLSGQVRANALAVAQRFMAPENLSRLEQSAGAADLISVMLTVLYHEGGKL